MRNLIVSLLAPLVCCVFGLIAYYIMIVLCRSVDIPIWVVGVPYFAGFSWFLYDAVREANNAQ